MKIRLLIATMLIASLLVCGCSDEQPSTEGPSEHLLDEGLASAAMDTVIRFNKSGMRRATSSAEIPKEFWAPEIKDLEPLKVYWHNNNLAIVLRDSSDEVDGMYVYVPISSYLPRSGDTIQLAFGQETYTFKVNEPVEPPGGGNRSEPANGGATLEGTEWILTSLNGNSPVEDSTITLGFYNRNEISGNGGCNNYFTRYGASGDGFITIPQGIERTKWGCDVSEGILQQEDAYFEALANAATYRVMNDRLEFDTATGETILTFVMKEDPPIDPTLDDTEWVLNSLNGSNLLEGSNITLNFAGGEVGGFAGCNAYGGEYTAADEGAPTIPGFAITEQLCQTPDGIMQQEDAYTEALLSAATYRVMDDRLEIANAAGETTLVFTMKEEFPMDPHDLVGTAWQIVSMDGHSPVEGATITLAFHDENQVNGSAGCRDYVATYEASGDDMRFPQQSMIGAACLDQESLMRQEGQYTDRLSWATNYRLSEDQLEIFTARGEVLVFEPLPENSDASLEGTTWVLIAFIKEKTAEGMDIPLPMVTNLLAETAITATFEDGTVSGPAGCNTYFAAYARDGSFLTCETPAATEMWCSGPAGVMEQEQLYLGLLEDVTVYRIYGSQLWLEMNDGRALVFTAQE